MYLKCTSFIISKDQTTKEQEWRRQAYAQLEKELKMHNKWWVMTYGIASSLKIIFWKCRVHPWNNGLGLSDVSQDIDIIFRFKYQKHHFFIVFNIDFELSLLWLDYTCVCGNIHYITKHGCSNTSEKYRIILFCTMTYCYDLSQLKHDNDDEQARSENPTIIICMI